MSHLLELAQPGSPFICRSEVLRCLAPGHFTTRRTPLCWTSAPAVATGKRHLLGYFGLQEIRESVP